ncbi:MAG TPA: hypothetical protein VGB25_03340 [Candidatus Binatia bacterium]
MKWKALLAVIGVFLVGLVCGALVGRSYLRPDKFKDRYDRSHVRALSKELGLSEEQRKQIDPSLRDARRELFGLRLESYDKADRIILRLQDQIRLHLKQEQTVRLDTMMKKYHSQRDRYRARLQRRIKSLSESNPSR